MKREFLEGLGLEKELIDSIMSEHGKSVGALKERCLSLEEKEALSLSLEGEKEALAASLEDEKRKAQAFRIEVITELVDEASPSSELAKRELVRLLAECDGGAVKARLEELKRDCPDAFVKKQPRLPRFSSSEAPKGEMPSLNYRRLR